MALVLKQPDSNSIILRRSLVSRLSSLIWFGGAGMIMFAFKHSQWIWMAFPCLLIGVHLLTYTVRLRLWRPGRDILWKRRILLLFGQQQPLPFAGVRSVRIGGRGTFLKMFHLYFLLVDASKLSITHDFAMDRLQTQGKELARFIGRPLVYEQPEEDEPRNRKNLTAIDLWDEESTKQELEK